MKRRRALAGLPLAFALGACGAGTPPPAPADHVIVLMVDTLRADYVGTYGFDGDISPEIDALAADGIVFEQAISQAPWTQPAVASLFTSLHPGQHGMERFDLHPNLTPKRVVRLSPELPTLAELFRHAGYSTRAYVANPWLSEPTGMLRGFESSRTQPSTDDMLEQALRFLAGTTQRGGRSLLYVHLMDVHGPYTCSEAEVDRLLPSKTLPDDRALTDAERSALGYLARAVDRSPWAAERSDSLRFWAACYAAQVASLDAKLGAFFDGLRKLGVYDDSLIVLLSDHGEELLDHGDWEHGKKLLRHTLRTPLVVKLAGSRQAGLRIPAVVQHVDLLPTLLRLQQIALPETAIEGVDLSHLWTEGEQPERAAFSGSSRSQRKAMSLQRGRQRFSHDPETGESQLFDIAADPAELQNLAAESPERAAALRAELEAHRLRVGESGPARETSPLPEEIETQLRALGYLE